MKISPAPFRGLLFSRAEQPTLGEAEVFGGGNSQNRRCVLRAQDEVRAMLRTLLCQVEIRSDRVDITLSRCRLTELLAGWPDLKMQHQAPTSAPDDLLRLTVPVGL